MEDRNRYKAPIIPVLKVTATVLLVITTAMAYYAGEVLFLHLGDVVPGFELVYPVIWVVLGLFIGLLIYTYLMLNSEWKMKIGYFGLAIFCFMVFVTPFFTVYGAGDYWTRVRTGFIINFTVLGNIGLYVLAMMPTIVGFFGIWRGRDKVQVIPAVLVFIPLIYAAGTHQIGPEVEIFAFVYVFFLIITFLISDIRMMADQMNVMDDFAQKTLSRNIMRFLSFLPVFTVIFAVIVVIAFYTTDIIAAVGPPMASESIELRHTLYVTGGALLNIVVALWITGFAMRTGWPWLRSAIKRKFMRM